MKTMPKDPKEAKRLFTSEGRFPDLNQYTYDNGDQIDGGRKTLSLLPPRWTNQGVSALEVENYLAILFRDDNYSGICEVFNNDDPALGSGGDVIGNDQASSMMILKGRK